MTGGMSGWPRAALRPERMTAVLVLLLIGATLLLALNLALYLVFIIATILVARSVPVEPGAWLGRRAVRRSLVAVITLICLVMTVTPYQVYASSGILLLLFLALCDVLLGRATRRIAAASDDSIDEREETLRNRAHRYAYAILALAFGAVVGIADGAGSDSRAWLNDAQSRGGGLIAFFQLVFFLPAMVVAWLEPDRLTDEAGPTPRSSLRARAAVGMVVVTLLTPAVLSLGLAVLPVRVTTMVRSEPARSGVSCNYFGGSKQVGFGLGAALPISAVACWDGTTAYEAWGLNDSDCHPSRAQMVTVGTTACRRITEPDGTLRFTYHAVVRSAVLPFVTRDVVVTLALAPDGRVVQFP